MRRRKAELEWTNAAEIHLEEIRAYIARDSAMQAVRFIARIRKAVERLRDFPRSGEVLDFEAQKELREIYVK